MLTRGLKVTAFVWLSQMIFCKWFTRCFFFSFICDVCEVCNRAEMSSGNLSICLKPTTFIKQEIIISMWCSGMAVDIWHVARVQTTAVKFRIIGINLGIKSVRKPLCLVYKSAVCVTKVLTNKVWDNIGKCYSNIHKSQRTYIRI